MARLFGLMGLHHFFLFNFFVDHMTGGKFGSDVIHGNAHLRHEDHDMVCKVGNLIHCFFFVVVFGGDNNFGRFFTDLF